MVLHLFFTIAFSAAPLTLYIPPVRSLNLFVETVEAMWKESSAHTLRLYPRLRYAFSRLINSMLSDHSA
ncbi:DIS3-exonuclease-like protein [Salvia divinorum]|uniref:DIS3-exonuclease-like protein n=1 Tax=Salvia divinorum TaxID=28513 RepID=A0ABD1HZP5_SALDI